MVFVSGVSTGASPSIDVDDQSVALGYTPYMLDLAVLLYPGVASFTQTAPSVRNAVA